MQRVEKRRSLPRKASIDAAFRDRQQYKKVHVYASVLPPAQLPSGIFFASAETRRLIIDIFIIFSSPMHRACNMQW